MNHSKQEIQAFNKWCAALLVENNNKNCFYSKYGKSITLLEQTIYWANTDKVFDPYYDANDRNLVIDVFRPSLFYNNETGRYTYISMKNSFVTHGPTTDEAQIAYLFEEMKHEQNA